MSSSIAPQLSSPPPSPPPLPVKQSISTTEFVALAGLLMASVALAIDAVLPALGFIASDLAVSTSQVQWVIMGLFAGFAIGQIIYGPLSDSIGRLPCIYAGFVLYVLGCILALVADSLETLVIGRIVQGFGAAGPRIIIAAIIRDCFVGRPMARMTSLVSSVFMLVPILAPSVGQLILWLGPWQYIFVFYSVMVSLLALWVALRLQETLPADARHKLNLTYLRQSAVTVISNKKVMGYTLASGIIFGGFLGYLSASQVIFQNIYQVGDAYPLYFAALVLPNIISSIINAKLVMRYGMYRLVQIANVIALLLGIALYAYVRYHQGVPPLPYLMVFLLLLFGGMGFQYGNLTALAMEPLGKVAGMGASLNGAIGMLVAIPIGSFIGQAVKVDILPFALGMPICSAVTLIVIHWLRYGGHWPTKGKT